jgi:hypothetical protein
VPVGVAVLGRVNGADLSPPFCVNDRASFKTWCGDHSVPRELAELSLAHRIGNAVEQAYDRTALLERRRPVMAALASFLEGDSAAGKVVKLKR